MSDLSEKTRVSLYAVLACVPFMVGYIFWMSSLNAAVENNIKVNAAQDIKIEQSRDLLIDIRERIIRIEGKLPNTVTDKK